MTLLRTSCVASEESFHSPLWPSVSPSIKWGRYGLLAEWLGRSCEGRREIVLHLSVQVTVVPCPVQSGCFGSLWNWMLSQSRQLKLRRPPLVAYTLSMLPTEKPAADGSPPVPVERREKDGVDCRPCPETCTRRPPLCDYRSLGPGGAIRKAGQQLWIQSSHEKGGENIREKGRDSDAIRERERRPERKTGPSERHTQRQTETRRKAGNPRLENVSRK